MTEGAQRNLILWFFLALFVVSIALLGWLLQPFISIIILGAVVTGIFSPLYRRIGRKLRPSWASFLTCLLIFFVLFVPTVFFVSILSTEAYDLYEKAKGAVLSENMAALFEGSRMNTLIRKSELLGRFKPLLTLLGFDPASGGIQRALSEIAKTVGFLLYQQASAVATNILSFLFSFFLMLMVTYYLLIDGHRLLAFIISLSPLPPDQDQKLIQKFKDMAGAILIGNGLGGLIQGVLGGGLFAVFGLNSPFLWGVIIALTAFLPIVGSGVVFLPAAAMLLLKGRTAAGIFFILFFIVLFGSIEYVFKPQLVGSRFECTRCWYFCPFWADSTFSGRWELSTGPLW